MKRTSGLAYTLALEISTLYIVEPRTVTVQAYPFQREDAAIILFFFFSFDLNYTCI